MNLDLNELEKALDLAQIEIRNLYKKSGFLNFNDSLLNLIDKQLEKVRWLIKNGETFDHSGLSKSEKQKYWDNFKITYEKLKQDQNIMRWCSDLKLTKFVVISAINDYFNECISKEDIYRNFLDYKSHCFNWIKAHQSKYPNYKLNNDELYN